MGRTPIKTCLQRRHTGGQTHEKMLSIIHYYGNAGEDYINTQPHSSRGRGYLYTYRGFMYL